MSNKAKKQRKGGFLLVLLLAWLLICIVLAVDTYALKVTSSGNSECLIDCETTYSILADSGDLLIGEGTFWFEFRNKPSSLTTHAREVSELKSMQVLSLNEKSLVRLVDTPEEICNMQIVNGTEQKVCTTVTHRKNETFYYTEFEPLTSKTVRKGETAIIKILGTKDAYANVDNVPVIYNPDKKVFEKFTQYAWWNSSWTRCRQINISSLDGGIALNNFPVYLNWNASATTSTSLANGSDLRFTNGSSCTGDGVELPFEVEWYNNTDVYNESVWVKVNLSSGTTSIAMYYNNPSASMPLPTASNGRNNVWSYDAGGTDFRGVYHLNTNGYGGYTYNDSTSNYLNGTNSGTVDNSASKNAGGRTWDTNTDYVSFGDTLDVGTQSYTWEYWVQTDSITCASLQIHEGKFGGVGQRGWYTYQYNTAGTDCDYMSLGLSSDGTALATFETNNVINVINTWYYVAVQYIPSTSVIMFIGNTTTFSNTTYTVGVPATIFNNAQDRRMGVATGAPTTWGLLGDLDEARFSNTSRGVNWLNATFQNQNKPSSYLTFGSEEARFDSTITTNATYTNPVFETVGYNYKLLLSWTTGSNVTNVSSVNLTFNNTVYNAVWDESTINASNWTVRGLRMPLVSTNNTALVFNWTYTAILSNGSESRTTSNTNNIVKFVLYPSTTVLAYTQNVSEASNQNLISYLDNYGANLTGVTFNGIFEWNLTNYSNSSYADTFILETFNYNVPIGLLGNGITLTNATINITPYFNITWNGTTLTRNKTVNANNQTIHRMILTSCANTTNLTIQQFNIRDISTNNLVNADLNLQYYLWNAQTYNNASLYRAYNFSFAGNSSPYICVYPNITGINYVADYNSSASMTGYLTSSNINTNVALSSSAITNTTIYLTNSTGSQEVVITVTDQNDNELTNYSVQAYLYNSTYTLLDTQTTNLQGQVRFNLYIYGRTYQFRVYYPNGTLAVSAPTTGGSTIISTSFTIKVYLVPQVTIGNVVEMLSLLNNLTFNNVTGLVNLTFNDSASNLTSYNCLQIMNMSAGNNSVLALNCTTNQAGTLTFSLGNRNGTFVAQYIATRTEDSLNYLVNYLVINRNVYFNFQREGIFWSFLLIGTIAAIGLFINPVLGIIFMEFGIIASWWIGILPIGWMALASIIAGGFFVAFFLGKEQ